MSDTWQNIIVAIVVAIAFGLALRSIIRAIKHKKSALNPCKSCQLKAKCNKAGKFQECEKQK